MKTGVNQQSFLVELIEEHIRQASVHAELRVTRAGLSVRRIVKGELITLMFRRGTIGAVLVDSWIARNHGSILKSADDIWDRLLKNITDKKPGLVIDRRGNTIYVDVLDQPAEDIQSLARTTTIHDNDYTWRHFSSPKVMTKEQAVAVQTELGYHPAGYSFADYSTCANGTRWMCYHSCD